MNAPTYIKPKKKYYAYFDHFGEIEMLGQAVIDCSHPGDCDSDVEHWAPLVARPEDATKEKIREELKECGAWDKDELDNDEVNWQRIVWIAAGNICENEYELARAKNRFRD